MTALRKSERVTFDDYLAFEAECQERHEFVDGYPFELAGESDNHYCLIGQIFAELDRLPRESFEAFEVEMKVLAATTAGPFVYSPDVVVSRAPDLPRGRLPYRSEPILVVEVLSPDSERIDSGEKKLAYLQIRSLQEYVLVAEDKPKVEIMRRRTSWVVAELYPGDTLELESVGLSLPLTAIYQTITF